MELFLKDNLWIRIVLLNMPVQVLCVKILELFLGKGKRQNCLLAFMLFKMTVLCYFQSMGNTVSWSGRVFEVIFGAVSGILCVFICIYMYETESVKILFLMAVSEVTAACVLLLSVSVVNVMEGRSGQVFNWYAPFRWEDLCGYIPELMIGSFLYTILKKFRDLFGKIEIPNSRLIWFVYLCYFLLMQFSQLMGLASEKGIIRGQIIPCMIVAAGTVIGICVVLSRYQTDTQMESRFLQMQLNLMQDQYCSMQQQKVYMEECSQLIECQMQEIIQNRAEDIQSDKITDYLEDLKKEYQKIRAGLYCKDWTLDAILYVQIEQARKQGMEVQCRIQNYPKSQDDVQCMGKILMELFGYVLSREQKKKSSKLSQIQVQMDHIAGQEILIFTCQAEKKVQELKKKIQRLIKDKDGNVEIEQTQGQMRIGITFAGENK